MLLRRAWILLLALVLPAMLLLPVWRNHGLGAGEDDILYYWPMRLHFQRCLDGRELPLFNPWNGLGRPLLADPQTAIFYPATWLFALAKVEFTYPLHLYLHFALALWGAYRLARSERLHAVAAVFAAIAFAFSGFMLAHRPHFTMHAAAAWAPIVVWRIGRAVDSPHPSGGRRVRAVVLAAVCLALQALAGHVQMAALTALGCIVLCCARRTNGSDPRSAAGLRQRGVLLTLIFGAGAALFAVQALPTWRYMRECERAAWSYWQFTENSLLPSSALTMLSPFLLGQRTPNAMGPAYWGPSHQSEQTGYVGVSTLLLALLSLRLPWRAEPDRSRWAWLLAAAVLLALGRYGPLCPLLYRLPGSQLFRCPARALLLIDLALAMLAAKSIDDLARNASPTRARLRWVLQQWGRRWLWLAGAIFLAPILAAALAIPALDQAARSTALQCLSPANPALWAAALAAISSVGVIAVAARRGANQRIVWLLPAVLSLDLGVVGWSIDVPPRRIDLAVDAKPDPANEWLGFVTHEPGRLWVVTPPHDGKPGEYWDSIHKAVANTNLLEPVELLTDYGPLQPRAYVRTFSFRPWGETARAAELLSDNDWMSALRVSWVLLCDDALPEPPNATLKVRTSRGWRLYRIDEAANAPLAQPVSGGGPGDIDAHWRSNHEIEFEIATDAESNGAAGRLRELQFAVAAIDGWWISTDSGRRAIAANDGDLILHATVNPQTTRGALRYSPPGLLAGATISIATAGLLALLVTASFFVPSRYAEGRSSSTD